MKNRYNHIQALENNHTLDDNEAIANADTVSKAEFQIEDSQQRILYTAMTSTPKDASQPSTPQDYLRNPRDSKSGSSSTNTISLLTSLKQKYSTKRSPQLGYLATDENQMYDRSNIFYVDEDPPEANESNEFKGQAPETQHVHNDSSKNDGDCNRLAPTVETLL